MESKMFEEDKWSQFEQSDNKTSDKAPESGIQCERKFREREREN